MHTLSFKDVASLGKQWVSEQLSNANAACLCLKEKSNQDSI